jgi:hypothetical protein
MKDNVILMPGSDLADPAMLRAVAGEFGWSIDVAHNLRQAAKAQINRNTVACLLHRDALSSGNSWLETIRLARLNMPEVRLIACKRFSETIGWPELSDAGAFDAIWLPLRESEVRRSFGFVWEAERRDDASMLQPTASGNRCRSGVESGSASVPGQGCLPERPPPHPRSRLKKVEEIHDQTAANQEDFVPG